MWKINITAGVSSPLLHVTLCITFSFYRFSQLDLPPCAKLSTGREYSGFSFWDSCG